MLKADAQTLVSRAWLPSAGTSVAQPVEAGPEAIALPVMEQDWLGLSFLHWPYEAAAVQRLVPPQLTVETFDGVAWVGLVLFLLRVRIPHGPALAWIGAFPETNVRSYVRGPDGHSGIWFLSLDAPRHLAIWAARLTYRLPYRVAVMHMHCEKRVRTYASWRRGGPHRGATSRARVTYEGRIAPLDVPPLAHFLTARWRLYAPLRRGIGTARVEHAPWALWHADADDIDARLLVAAGLPAPVGDPLAHACDDVRASLTRLVRCREAGGCDDE